MKRVLAIIGSPRKLGNSEIMAKEISRHLVEPHELRLLRLSDFDLQPCRGCYACLFTGEGCVIEDDFARVVEEILHADAYIVAVPTYFLGPASVLKRFTDRGLALLPHIETLWGRPGIAVAPTGIADRQGYSELGLESFLKCLMAEIKAVRVVFGALPGEIFYEEAGRKTAVELAAALFGDKCEDEGPSCPVCGGRTFRFEGSGRARCMLCSNVGPVTGGPEDIHFDIRTTAHEMFTSREEAIAHREWLQWMKQRFKEEKSRLKSITLDYLEGGTWVTPG